MNGDRSSLAIGQESMTMSCFSCKNHTPHEANVCSHKYKGSLTGMEAIGASRLVQQLFADGTLYIGEYISDG
jgi:hypothetical protein